MANEEEVTPENAGESIEFDNVSQDNDLDCLKEPEQPLGGMDEAVSSESGAESEPDMSVALAELKKAVTNETPSKGIANQERVLSAASNPTPKKKKKKKAWKAIGRRTASRTFFATNAKAAPRQ